MGGISGRRGGAGSSRTRVKLVVVWDDGCSFCARWVRLARRLDSRQALEFVGLSDRAALARLGIGPEEADREVKVVGLTRIFGGYDGVVEIARRLPATGWMAPLLAWARPAGRMVYRWVAAHRKCRV